MSIYTVILAGGSGTRLWPLSRAARPKQFLKFCDEGTLLQKTLKRNQLSNNQKTFLVTGVEHIHLINEQLKEIDVANYTLIIEPEPKNTAPAIIAAALEIYKTDPEAIIIVAPSDNEIKHIDHYKAAVEQGRDLAKKGYYAIFGIKPTRPEIAYGYLKKGKEINPNTFTVESFVEKPNIDKACEYVNEGNYFWNSGIFVFPVARLLKEMSSLEPHMYGQVEKSLEQAQRESNSIVLAGEPFSHISGQSIDYALMEKTHDVAFVEYMYYWNDMGTWYSVWETQKKDVNGNVLCQNTIAYNTKNSLVASHSGKLIATVDMENVNIIETPDALLVANANSNQNIKDIVKELSLRKRPEIIHHNVVIRPWGTYETLAKEGNFLIKKIVVKPGHKLSLQYHHHRSEHWVVVKGRAEVVVGEEIKTLTENQYVFIPKMEKHRLANVGEEDLHILETQFGAILEESDIVRIEDVYGRVL